MPKPTEAANDAGTAGLTVADSVFELFYKELETKPEFKDIAARFRAEENRSEDALKKILFGDDK